MSRHAQTQSIDLARVQPVEPLERGGGALGGRFDQATLFRCPPSPLELALWCDLRVVEEDAVFGVFCRRWGVPLIDGGTVRLPRLIGESRALDLILTGRAVGAEEAFAIGLANRVVPRGESRAAAEALAHQLAALPQGCLRSDRRCARQQWGRTQADALGTEFAAGLAVLTSGESAAGAGRFVGGAGRGGTPA